MKKLLLLMLVMIISLTSFSQDRKTFVKQYHSFITEKNGKLSEWQDGNATIVFNSGNTTNIIIYFPGSSITLYRKGDLEEGKTKSGEEYQGVYCIDSSDGTEVYLQLFMHCTRIFTGLNFIEYHD
jgi:hypothetical protein